MTSYVSTSSVVPRPSESTCARNASRSVSCSRVKACALVPTVGIAQRNPAARSEVASKPPTYAARAEATAESSWVRRAPISISRRPPAAADIREAAAAIAESWLRMERITVSSSTHSAKDPSTRRIGEPGK
ncbi:hypothetical protein GA0115253_1078710 [Streptomyces sp. Termitarium-T10T-6]|nr:hypothetical protein GA0115253_1078710 [Streptomyces sp. Termitarium-T10T-6]